MLTNHRRRASNTYQNTSPSPHWKSLSRRGVAAVTKRNEP